MLVDDPYEVDNTWVQARTIETDGAFQSHTFGSSTDEDWVTFSFTGLAAGTQVVIETSMLGSNADTALELYSGDPAVPGSLVASDDNGGGGRSSKIVFVASNITYWLRVRQMHPCISCGTNSAYDLSVDIYEDTSNGITRWIDDYGTDDGWSDQNYYPRAVADVNGDGYDDVIGFGQEAVWVSLSTGSSFAAPAVWSVAFTRARGWTSQDLYPRFVADVNGDHRADLVGFASDGIWVALSNGVMFGSSRWWTDEFGRSGSNWTTQTRYPRALADVNGDGKADVVGFGKRDVMVALSDGASFDDSEAWIRWYTEGAGQWWSQTLYPRFVADVDGDGDADIVGCAWSGVYVSLSRGDRFGTARRWITYFAAGAGGWTSQDLWPRAVADVDGDGMADMIGFGDRGVYLSMSEGNRFGAAWLDIEEFGRRAGDWTRQRIYPRLMGDVNSDGLADIVGFDSDGVYVALAHDVSPTSATVDASSPFAKGLTLEQEAALMAKTAPAR
jgi:hypothetical protein